MSTPLKAMQQSAGRISVWREHRPGGALADVVEATWQGVGGWTRQIRLLPDGCADIVWDGERLNLFQPRTAAVRRTLTENTHTVGLRLRCGFAGLLSAPDGPGGPSMLPLAPAWGALAAEGEARLGAQRDPDRQREILLDLVGRRLAETRRPGKPPLELIAALKAGVTGVEALARSQDWPVRELRRTFAKHVGLSPKALQRVFRFRRLLDALPGLAHGRGTGARLAAEFGYADQAHMIRECRAISGATPGQLIRSLMR